MNSKIYLLVLSSLFFLGCSKKQKDGVIGKDPVEILNNAFMQSGDVAAWSENQAIKFGFSKIVFQAEGGQSDAKAKESSTQDPTNFSHHCHFRNFTT